MLKIYHAYSELDLEQILGIYKEAIERDYPSNNAWESPVALFLDDLRLFFRCKYACLAVWEEDGRLVSALRLEPYKDGYLISCVETPQPFRRNSYASKLLGAVLYTENLPFYVHIAKNNVPSIRLHEKVGFIKYADHAVFVDGSVYTSYFTFIKK